MRDDQQTLTRVEVVGFFNSSSSPVYTNCRHSLSVLVIEVITVKIASEFGDRAACEEIYARSHFYADLEAAKVQPKNAAN